MKHEIISQNDPSALAEAARILNNGGVLAVPTETVYGLATLWDNPKGREKIYHLKHRPAEKRLQMLAANLPSLKKYGLIIPERLPTIAARFWPGALTAILPTESGDTIGLRIPNHPFLLELLKMLGRPLAATSANLSGMTPGLDVESAVAHLDGSPDLLIDGGRATITGGQSSTVVNLCQEPPVILREGPVSLQDILTVNSEQVSVHSHA